MDTSRTATIEAEDSPPISKSFELREFLDAIPVGGRKERFRTLAEAMIDTGRPVCILETGCMRQSEQAPPEADGCSTLVWDYVAKATKGACVCIDINPANVEYTKSKVSQHTQVYCADSVSFITQAHFTRPIDFLYLDSMDWQGEREE